MNQYVLYNNCFGGFSFSRDFILSLFKYNPSLFSEVNTPGEYTTSPFFGDYVFLHIDNDYPQDEPSYVKNIKTNKIYYISTHREELRANPEVIKFLFECADSMSEEQFNHEYDKLLSKNLFAKDRNELVSKDGTKKFSINNWKNSELLVSHMLTIGISGFAADIKVAMVKPGLTWSIREYDGFESVCVKFDYYKMIQELVNELQLNNIQPSTSCSELVTKLIRGDTTIDQLKEYERS
jgi:hypothetical protein